MSEAAKSAIGSHCLRKQHDHCLVPESCACQCHAIALRPLAAVPQVPNAAGKYKPTIGLEWEDPPAPHKPKTLSLIAALVPEIKRHPGKWAKVATYKGTHSGTQAAATLRKQHPDLEVTSRRTDDGGSVIYVRARPE